ncbi:Putative glycosyltransferase EpsF [Flagellimonas maritima]|uniref:Glycosyltransferase EpsF n=1 Tax=Flagellimonas maritima TaxID=1383885 RepID=A0A2Z4LV62_9FLAO|nr:glycosyltransferase family 1 protein [Allomuricauda aurantiaca]AWX45805.1 Putative glycosyltransferase EpsF [Allomuricauda aurantiaca]
MNRILHVVGGMNRAGAETMIMNLYRKINREKYQFDFLYFTEEKCDYDQEIEQLGGRIFRISEKNSKNPISRTIKIKRLIKKEHPFYAIHCHQLFSNFFHLLAGYLAGIDFRIAHSHNTSDVNSKKWSGRVYQRVSRLLISKLATHFIACGKQAGEFLFPYSKNIILLPNAVDLKKFSTQTTIVPDLRELYKLNSNTIIVCQVGRLNPVKNHIFTIDFAKYLKDKNVDIHFFIVGDGPLKGDLIKKINSLDVSGLVTLLGVREDIQQIMSNSDLMIMPSIHEGFPVVLVESQATGMPALISSNISKEVDLNLGLVQFSDLEDNFNTWFEKIVQLTESKKPTQDEIRQTFIAEGFDINVSVERLENLYGQGDKFF